MISVITTILVAASTIIGSGSNQNASQPATGKIITIDESGM